MKKIVFVTNSLYSGGAERVMSVLANEFAGIYDTTIISKAQTEPFYLLKKEVKLVFPKTRLSYNNFVATAFGRLKVYFGLFLILKKSRPDVVITFCSRTNGTVIPLCKLLRIKVIASEHLNYKANSKIRSIAFIKKYIYPHADVLTVLTDRDKNDFYGKYLKNVVVMPNPLPLAPVTNISPEKKRNIILAVGEVSRWEHKGFDSLITIFSELAPKFPDWNLEIAGTGDATFLNNLIAKFNMIGRIILLGEVRNIQELMQQAKIYALSSRWEGLPMVLIESMSQGLPCIAFDCFTGPGDIITNGIDGILVEDQNMEEFSSKLSLLIENPELRLQLGYNAIESSKRYTPGDIVAKWQQIIEH